MKRRLLDILPDELDRKHPLLEEALTHRSASRRNNERLEFLGDGVLNLLVAEALYRALPDASEGVLSRMRSRLVRRETLAEIAQELEIGNLVRLGQGERKSGGYRRESILADALEAVIGAVYLALGFDKARDFVLTLFQDYLNALPHPEQLKDPKTRLQEWLQGRGMPPPDYHLVETTGLAHQQKFRVKAQITDMGLVAHGEGSSRKKAEQQAAAILLEEIAQRD